MEVTSTEQHADESMSISRLLSSSSLEVCQDVVLSRSARFFHHYHESQGKGKHAQGATATPAIKIKAKSDVQDVLQVVCEAAAEMTGEDIATDALLMSAGLDSLSVMELTQTLGAQFSMDLAPTILFDHPTLESLAGFISGTLTSNEAARPTI